MAKILKKVNCKIIFIVVGRLGVTLTQSKVLPIIASNQFDRIFVFREERGIENSRVEYVTLEFLKKIKFLPLRRLIRLFVEPIQLIIYAIRYRPYLINGYQLMPKGIYSFIAAKISFTNCMVSSIGGIPEIDTYSRHKWFFKSINLFVLKHANIVTTKGETVSNYIIQHGVSASKVFTFNGAIDTNIFFNDNTIDKNIDIIFIGNFSPLKGPDRFVNIVKEVSITFPHIKSVMVGDGILQNEIGRLVIKYGLENNIQLLGYVSSTANLLKQSKIIIIPSTSEGLATAMLEAMACGCVPIVSDVGCMNEAAKQNETAMLVKDFNDINGFATSTIKILSNKDFRKILSVNAQNLVQTKYSVEEQGKIYSQIVSTLN